MLQVNKLTKSFGSRQVLRSVSFDAAPAEITSILGPNGSGKSTIIHLLAGLLAATSGTAHLYGAKLNMRSYRNNVGLCPDDLPQPELLTGREYLQLVQGIRRLKVPEEALGFLVAGFRLDLYLDSLLATYSHGMKRKIQIIASLLHQPKLIMLDEPFRGLDPESSEIIRALLIAYAKEGRIVLLSTHDLQLAEQLCQKVVILREGGIVLEGNPADLARLEKTDSFRDSFLAATGLDGVLGESVQLFIEGLALLNVEN